MKSTMEQPAPMNSRTRVRRRPRSIHAISHVAQMHYETATADEHGAITWTDRGCRVVRVAAADQATADHLPYTSTADDLISTPTGIDYTDVAQCRLSVVVTNEAGQVFTSSALFYPHLARNAED
jgi:hypothetical protein